ncbi:hypothetical protein KKB18_12970 [bacterium]|nr:hypothetical protein [bacterium]
MKNKLFISVSLILFLQACWFGSSFAAIDKTEEMYCQFEVNLPENVFDDFTIRSSIWYNSPLSGIGSSAYWSIIPWSNCVTPGDYNVVVTVYTKVSSYEGWSPPEGVLNPLVSDWVKIYDTIPDPYECDGDNCGSQFLMNCQFEGHDTTGEGEHMIHNYYYYGSFAAINLQYLCIGPLLNQNIDTTYVWQVYDWCGPFRINTIKYGPFFIEE